MMEAISSRDRVESAMVYIPESDGEEACERREEGKRA
jgi:hypothetical protein